MHMESVEGELAAAIAELSRELSRTVPPPKAAPYFGLDNDKPYDLNVLEGLSSPGIFRKYEIVLLLRAGLGGAARWLSRRLGCRVLGIDRDVPRVAAAQALNRRARLTEQVSFGVSDPARLAFRDRIFTHVWSIDPPREYRTPAALREAFRVLRSGAHFALQTVVQTEETLSELEEQLQQAGFIDLRIEGVVLVPPDHVSMSARTRLLHTLSPHPDVLRAWNPEVLVFGTDAVRIFCRRP
jgi:SAM-dependent methyltransferase